MFCGKVKEFLSQNKVEYTERNIVADETALAELEKLGYMTTPVTVIDGAVVVGFDVPKLLVADHNLMGGRVRHFGFDLYDLASATKGKAYDIERSRKNLEQAINDLLKRIGQ